MKRPIAALLAIVLAASSGWTQADDLATGIRQVEGGEFEAAIITLDAAARRLAARGASHKDLARAYTYLAIAYLGLSQEQMAKAKFLEALKTDSTLDLDPSQFPPRIVEFFEKARREAQAAGQVGAQPQPAAPAATPPPPSAPPAEKRGGSKALPILLGVGAAAGVGIAVAGGGGGGNGPTPQPSPTPTPDPGFVALEIRLNGARSGTFSCNAQFNFAIIVANRTSATVRANTFQFDMTSLEGPCSNFPFPGDTSALQNRDVAAGTGAVVRTFDYKGQLCDRPQRPGCRWRASALVNTTGGSPTDSIEFTTR